jgi:hypothetical protein
MAIYLGSVPLRQNQYNDGRRSISLIKEREVSFTLNEKHAIHYITDLLCDVAVAVIVWPDFLSTTL